MKNKNFTNISQEECLYSYKDILKTSDEHWESSQILAREGKYGPAISLSIASIEELIKSIIVLYDAKGFEIRKIKGMDMFFKQHNMRYVIAYFLFVAGGLFDECFREMETFFKDTDAVIRHTEELKKNPQAVYKKIKIFFFKKYVLLKREMKWFSKLDTVRQKGFYCDYEDELKRPTEISDEDFKDVVGRLKIVKKAGKMIIESLENDKEKYKEIIEELKANNNYEEVARELALVKAGKKKFFDLLN